MIIIGGVASISGSIIGALFLAALPEVVSRLADNIPFVQKGTGSGITVGEFSEIIYALFLALFLVVEPRGLAGIFNKIKMRLRK
jgi:branched-chain amino acid transport system permease protein